MSSVLRRREADTFTCFTDVVVAPTGAMPAVQDTDALAALDAHLRAAPAVNRLGIRAMLLAVEIAPRLTGHGARLGALDPAGRTAAVTGLRRHKAFGPMIKALQSLSHMTYYGDDRVMRLVGYDADAVVARATAAREQHGGAR